MKYIKTGKILNLIAQSDEENRPLYIAGPIGCGKTAAIEYYYRRTAHHTIDCADGRIAQKADPNRIRAGVIIFDNVSYLREDASIQYALDVLKNTEKHVIFVSRAPRPVWMMSDSIDEDILLADERDMHFTKEQVFKFLVEHDVTADEEQMLTVMEESRSNPLLLKCLAFYMKDSGVYTKEVNTFARIPYHNYLDKELLGRMTQEEKDFLLAMCWYPSFTYEMAKALNNGHDCRGVIDSIQKKNAYILTFSSIGVQLADRYIPYLRHKREIYWADGRHEENLCAAAEYYQKIGNLDAALNCYETGDAHDKTLALLEKIAKEHPSISPIYELRDFYRNLSDEEAGSSWALAAARAMTESLLIKPKKSEKWFEKVKDLYEQETDLQEKSEIYRRVAYLDLMLPHHGNKNLVERARKAAEVLKGSDLDAGNEYVDLMPTVLHGTIDLCEYTKDTEKFLKGVSDLFEDMNQPVSEGIMDILRAEIGYEKDSLDPYKIFKMLNSGYVTADAEDCYGGCFAAIGVSAHLHLFRGEMARTEEILDGIRNKTVLNKKDTLLSNIDALYGWVDQLHANKESVNAWLETAPNEENGFTFLERSVLTCKVRAYIILGRFDAALDLIERLLAFCRMYDRTYAYNEIRLYQAIVYYRMRNPEYEKIIDEVMIKMQELGFYHLIADQGAAVLPLLEKGRPESVSKAYFDRLVTLTKKMAENFPNYLVTAEAPEEPLTRTERRVLHLLCEGLNAEEICSVMDISYSGIKFHNKNIYRKLGVNNRTEAVRKAFLLGMN